MNIDKSTCWYNNCTKEMNDYYNEFVKPFSKEELMDKVYHLKVFSELLKEIEGKVYPIDLGCGTAALSMFFDFYCGADLPDIIENSSKRNFPKFTYFYCDIIEDDLNFIDVFNLVILNAVIDIMQNPLEILEKILENTSDYLILHRQEVSILPTHIIKNESYGGFTYHSIINRNKLLELFEIKKFKIIKEINLNYAWENGGNSFLLKRVV